MKIFSKIIVNLDNLNKVLDYALTLYSEASLRIKILIMSVLLISLLPIAYFLILTYNLPHPGHASPTKLFPWFIDNSLICIHIGVSTPAFIVGPWLFHAKFRSQNPKMHRKLGMVYVLGCTLGAVTVFPLALANTAGFVAHLGFGVMAVLWFLVTYFAYNAAMNKDYVAHRRWMIRSYAMTFAFFHVNATYRLVVPYDMLTPQGIQALQSMVSWQANLLVSEIYLIFTTASGKFLAPKKALNMIRLYSPNDRIYLLARLPILKLKTSKGERLIHQKTDKSNKRIKDREIAGQ